MGLNVTPLEYLFLLFEERRSNSNHDVEDM